MNDLLIAFLILSVCLNVLAVFFYFHKDIEIVFDDIDQYELETLRLAFDKILGLERNANESPLEAYLSIKKITSKATTEIIENRNLRNNTSEHTV